MGGPIVAEGDDLAVAPPGTDLVGLAAPAETSRVIKTATLNVELGKGRFDRAYRDASLVASRNGGFVASSSTTKFEKARGANITLRVPASRFDAAVADLRELGEVTFEESSGEDVTATFVDLEARLRNWEAQESVLLRLMAEANTIDESIKVQRNLSEVQLEIERIRGQLRLLRDQTDFGTINLTLTEGDPEALLEVEEKDGSILGNAWRDAIEGFQDVLAATVVGLGYLIPIGPAAGDRVGRGPAGAAGARRSGRDRVARGATRPSGRAGPRSRTARRPRGQPRRACPGTAAGRSGGTRAARRRRRPAAPARR